MRLGEGSGGKKRNGKGNGGGFRLTRLEEYEGAVAADDIAEVETDTPSQKASAAPASGVGPKKPYL